MHITELREVRIEGTIRDLKEAVNKNFEEENEVMLVQEFEGEDVKFALYRDPSGRFGGRGAYRGANFTSFLDMDFFNENVSEESMMAIYEGYNEAVEEGVIVEAVCGEISEELRKDGLSTSDLVEGETYNFVAVMPGVMYELVVDFFPQFNGIFVDDTIVVRFPAQDEEIVFTIKE